MNIFGEAFEQEIKNIISSILDIKMEKLINDKIPAIIEYENKKGILFTPNDVVEYTKFSKSYVNQLLSMTLSEGGIPSIKIGSRRRIWKHELDEWLESKREE